MLTLLFAALASLVAVNWVYFKILRIALLKNIVDNPEARKLQKTPIPVMGGISVFFGIIVGIESGLVFCTLTGTPLSIPMYTIVCSMLVMLYVGSIDDILGLTPITRLIIEVLTILVIIYGSGGCIDSLHGLWGVEEFSWWIGVPFTIFACVGIINAINMIDGVNGLSSGLCIVCNCCFGYAFVKSGDLANGIINVTMAASLLPFLVHNVIGKRSKMFIGDAGTMVMGALMSWDIVQILRSDTALSWMHYSQHGLGLVAMTLAILAVPIWDTVRVMLLRIYHHKSPFDADRTHLHHVIYDYGHSHSLTSIIEISANLLIVACWAISYKLNCRIETQLYLVILLAFLIVWGGYFYLSQGNRRHTGYAYRLRRLFIASRQGQKDWWVKLQRRIDSEMNEE